MQYTRSGRGVGQRGPVPHGTGDGKLCLAPLNRHRFGVGGGAGISFKFDRPRSDEAAWASDRRSTRCWTPPGPTPPGPTRPCTATCRRRCCGYLRLQGAREPEDLTSEVFLGVFRGLGDFVQRERRPSSGRGCLTIAHRRLTDERRRVAATVPTWPDMPSPDHFGGDVEEDALRNLSVKRVGAACATPSPTNSETCSCSAWCPT